MPDSKLSDNEFLEKLTQLVESHLSDEHFGVSELAKEMGMSRSNLHRKLNPITKSTVSQFINHIRLKHGLKMLQKTTHTVSEVAYKVGFNSPSYFIKCFHDYYGYSPGEVGERHDDDSHLIRIQTSKTRRLRIVIVILFVVLIAAISIVIFKPFSGGKKELEKTIAVLPFIDDSPEDGNEYIVNGLREEILNKLEKIGELRVKSRTSAEKYKNKQLTIQEIAKELKVNYILEGSGQKIGNKIKITLQLIEAASGDHLWSNPYLKEVNNDNIFDLYEDVALAVAKEINAEITPEEKIQIDKRYTNNIIAWDFYQKGSDLLNRVIVVRMDVSEVKEAINYLEKAVENDDEFALAYSELARAYYYLDFRVLEKNYIPQISENADMAMYYDPQSELSYIAKAYHYITAKNLDLSIFYLEKALEINPNSLRAIVTFRQMFGVFQFPDLEQFLKYALLTINLKPVVNDNDVLASYYIRIGVNFRRAGFLQEAEEYFNKALELDPDDAETIRNKALLYYDLQKDIDEQMSVVLPLYKKDTANTSVLGVLFELNFKAGNYNDALKYYNKFVENNYSLNGRLLSMLGYIFTQIDENELAKRTFQEGIHLLKQYKRYRYHYFLSATYAAAGDTKNAILHMKEYAETENQYYYYFLIEEYKRDPRFNSVRHLPEFQKLLSIIESKFREQQKRIRTTLEKEELL